MKHSPYPRRWLFVTLLFATLGLLLLLLPLTSSAFALVMTPTRRGPTATPNCSEMPCDMVSPPPGVRATRTPIFKLPTHTVAATRSPRNQPSATPNLDELGAPATTGANVRSLAGLSSLASISVVAGDVNGLANAVNAVNAGTADTIFLSPSTYNMNGIGPFVFNTNVTIEGNGAIIEGGLTSQRVFSFRLGTVASIAHLTIRHAGGPNRSYGGAIGSRATLSIYDSVFDSNQALDGGGAIINAGTLNIYRTTFTGNSAGSGGAIQNEKGYLNIVCSRFLNNTADTGSILAAHGYSISVHKSRFTGNTSTVYGGGAIYRLPETPNTTFDVNGDNFWGNGGLPPVSDGPSVDSVSTGISVTSAASSDPTLNAECLQQATVVPTQTPVPTVTPSMTPTTLPTLVEGGA